MRRRRQRVVLEQRRTRRRLQASRSGTRKAKLIGRIRLPEVCGNVCFGGPKRNRLFAAASQSLYAVYVNTQGAGRVGSQLAVRRSQLAASCQRLAAITSARGRERLGVGPQTH